jgi:hypothetical protein
MCAPNGTLPQLAALNGRLKAHIDGLRVAAVKGWQDVEEATSGGGAQDVCPAALLAPYPCTGVSHSRWSGFCAWMGEGYANLRDKLTNLPIELVGRIWAVA